MKIFIICSIGDGNGGFTPSVGTNFAVDQQGNANAQVGDGPVAPSFGVGGQFNTQNGQLQPTFGTGLKWVPNVFLIL